LKSKLPRPQGAFLCPRLGGWRGIFPFSCLLGEKSNPAHA